MHSDDAAGELVRRPPDVPAAAAAPPHDDTRAFPRVAVHVPLEPANPKTPPELAGMLLPTEAITFASTPHPFILLRPALGIAVIAIVLVTLLGWQMRVLVHGHHIMVPLLSGVARTAALVVAGLLFLRELISLAGRLLHYFGFSVVSTNRRVFVVEGIFGRRVTPVGNTALAESRMSQGVFGRMFGFGDLVMPVTDSSPGTIRTMRDPVRLYREFQAVANGVIGDTWTPAIRQTQMP
ncbi:MAG: PH domain-containing protein [Candidatus Velthaea sp.]